MGIIQAILAFLKAIPALLGFVERSAGHQREARAADRRATKDKMSDAAVDAVLAGSFGDPGVQPGKPDAQAGQQRAPDPGPGISASGSGVSGVGQGGSADHK